MDKYTINPYRAVRRQNLLRLFCQHTIINTKTNVKIKGNVVDLFAVKWCAMCGKVFENKQYGYNVKIKRGTA